MLLWRLYHSQILHAHARASASNWKTTCSFLSIHPLVRSIVQSLVNGSHEDQCLKIVKGYPSTLDWTRRLRRAVAGYIQLSSATSLSNFLLLVPSRTFLITDSIAASPWKERCSASPTTRRSAIRTTERNASSCFHRTSQGFSNEP